MPSPLPSPFPSAAPAFGSLWRGDPRAALPLQGLTILAVEDSRFACEVLRLMCQRAGARLRRAETLEAARAHLRCYRPDIAIIDIGLPDGRGEVLIRELVVSVRRPAVILGTSGSTENAASALASGADGFLEKPLTGITTLIATLRKQLPVPEFEWPTLAEAAQKPDPLALHDDLVHAAAVLAGAPDATRRRYVSNFLSGVARLAEDATLAAAAETVRDQDSDLNALRDLVDCRLAMDSADFGPRSG